MKIFFQILILFAICAPIYSQNKLSPEDLAIMQKRATQYVLNFEYYIKTIAQTKEMEGKKKDIICVLDLFENNATIEVSNLNGTKKVYPISYYMNNVVAKYQQRYSVVVIEFLTIEIGKFKEKEDENGEIFYESTFKYTQLFCAQKSGLRYTEYEKRSFATCDYKDKSKKRGKVIVKKVTTINGESWLLYLSDITVEETTELN